MLHHKYKRAIFNRDTPNRHTPCPWASLTHQNNPWRNSAGRRKEHLQSCTELLRTKRCVVVSEVAIAASCLLGLRCAIHCSVPNFDRRNQSRLAKLIPQSFRHLHSNQGRKEENARQAPYQGMESLQRFLDLLRLQFQSADEENPHHTNGGDVILWENNARSWPWRSKNCSENESNGKVVSEAELLCRLLASLEALSPAFRGAVFFIVTHPNGRIRTSSRARGARGSKFFSICFSRFHVQWGDRSTVRSSLETTPRNHFPVAATVDVQLHLLLHRSCRGRCGPALLLLQDCRSHMPNSPFFCAKGDLFKAVEQTQRATCPRPGPYMM